MHKILYSLGLRKQAFVHVRFSSGTGSIFVNKKIISQYFLYQFFYLKILNNFFSFFTFLQNYDLFITIKGGGLESQVNSLFLALSRLFFKLDPLKFSFLKTLGFLKQDLRIKERKKYGLLKARKASQYSKR